MDWGIGLGHIRGTIDIMLLVGGGPMYWNWVLDWVISDDSSTKNCRRSTHVLEFGIGLGLAVHQQNDHRVGELTYFHSICCNGTLNGVRTGVLTVYHWYTQAPFIEI